jgi:diguanylate cyclase (GGDEF)-like protein
MKLLIVDDSESILAYLEKLATTLGLEPIPANSGSTALSLYREHKPDFILLDVEMPGMSGLDVAREIRDGESKSGSAEWTPIIFLTGLASDQQLASGIEAGGDDYLVKPVNPVVLSSKIQAMRRIQGLRQNLLTVTNQLEAANRKLQGLAATDGLTGLSNRRHLDEHLETEWRRAAREGQELSFMMVDVDFFKKYNDAYGHLQGDECLRRVASSLKESVRRPGDIVARYGGEEFAILLPNTPASGGGHVALLAQKRVAAMQIEHKASEASQYVTVSIGVATLTPKTLGESLETLTEQADQALYQAKRLGRNRVFSAGNLIQPPDADLGAQK